ncbi:hypothetical protein HK405_012253 [Cladochytrium tenue]|nr:hypothetical protein HK405_012253 [Cladochytrium tenue]
MQHPAASRAASAAAMPGFMVLKNTAARRPPLPHLPPPFPSSITPMPTPTPTPTQTAAPALAPFLPRDSMPVDAALARIPHYAKQPQTAVSLRQMVEFGGGAAERCAAPSQMTLLRAAEFLRRELPVRLARRVVDLDALPHGLSTMPSVRRVRHWYAQSFADLMRLPAPEAAGVPPALLAGKLQVGGNEHAGFRYSDPAAGADLPPAVARYNTMFMDRLDSVKRRHDPVAVTLAQGVMELKDHWRRSGSAGGFSAVSIPAAGPACRRSRWSSAQVPLPDDIQAFLDRFYLSRIGIRMLISQHVALGRAAAAAAGELPPTGTGSDHHLHQHRHHHHVGVICTRTSLRAVAADAVADARHVCQMHYGLLPGACPDVELSFESSSPVSSSQPPPEIDDVVFTYVPSHLHHVLFELAKNSLRAVVERYSVADAHGHLPSPPPVRIVVAAGNEDITVRVSDLGGGIPRSAMPLVWSYFYSSADRPAAGLEESGGGGNIDAPGASDFCAPLAG